MCMLLVSHKEVSRRIKIPGPEQFPDARSKDRCRDQLKSSGLDNPSRVRPPFICRYMHASEAERVRRHGGPASISLYFTRSPLGARYTDFTTLLRGRTATVTSRRKHIRRRYAFRCRCRAPRIAGIQGRFTCKVQIVRERSVWSRRTRLIDIEIIDRYIESAKRYPECVGQTKWFACYFTVSPESTAKTCPVTRRDSSEAR